MLCRARPHIRSIEVLLPFLLLLCSCTTDCRQDVETTWWESDSEGFLRFSTNDVQYCGHSFAAWNIPYFDPLERIEIEARKSSGNPWGAYGVLFCLQDLHGFYQLAIDVNGYYAVYKKVNDAWTEIIAWTYTAQLNSGYDRVNKIAVSYAPAAAMFSIDFNGTHVASFTDRSFQGGYSGLFVEVLPEEYEDFPAYPVEVRFRFKSVPGITVYPAGGLTTTEAGGPCSFGVKLDTRPAEDVTIELASSNPAEGVLNPPSLLFTSSNWSVAQEITATGADDQQLDGDQAYTIVTAPAVSADPAYSGLDAADVTITNLDDEVAPSAPTDLKAAAVSGSQIDLTWTDTSADEDGFEIERQLGFSATFALVASVAANTTGYSDYNVTLGPNRVYSYRVRARKDLGGSAYSGEASLVQKVTDPSAQAGDNFGSAVSIGGDYAIVNAKATGRVYRRLSGNLWIPSANLPVAGALSISGDYAAVGVDRENQSRGAVYVFHRTGTDSWDSGVRITVAEANQGYRFGKNVAIRGDYLIVGAAAASGSTQAYVFRRVGENSWDAGTKLVAPDGQSLDEFGCAVAIAGDYAVVGAQGRYEGLSEEGAVYVFRRTGDNAWDSVVKLVSPNAPSGEGFGARVAIDGDYLVVATQWCFAGYHHQVYVFHRIGEDSWDSGVRLEASEAQPSGDEYGCCVAIRGAYLVVGARWDDAMGYAAGAAYVFQRVGNNEWDSGAKLVAPDARARDEFGGSAAISGDHVIVGAVDADAGGISGGAAYFY